MTVFSTPDRVVISRTRGVTSWSMSRSTGDDRRLEVVAVVELARDRADDVVGLVARPSRRPGCRSALTTSRTFGNWSRRSSGIRARVALYSAYCSWRKVGPGQVERDREVVGLEVLDAAQDDAREAEDAVDELALRRRQGREREVAAVDEPVAVEQHQAFGGHVPKCTGGSRRDPSGTARAGRPVVSRRSGARSSAGQTARAR